jgi:hypothetical protein
MIRQSEIYSEIFARLSGKKAPALAHPTSNAFSPSDWRTALTDETPSKRDIEVCTGALFLFAQIQSLRNGPLSKVREAVSEDTFLRLGLAQSNRAYLLTRNRIRSHLNNKYEDPKAIFSANAHAHIGGSKMQPGRSADEVNTQIVDTIPHWFAQLDFLKDRIDSERPDYRNLGARAEAILSIERSLRNIWHSILWEGHRIDKIEGELAIVPDNFPNGTLWSAWEYRQESLNMQQPVLDALQVRQGFPLERNKGELTKTVVRKQTSGRTTRFKYGIPTKASVDAQLLDISAVENSYLGIFLDEQVHAELSEITPRILIRANHLLKDICNLMFTDISRPEIFSKDDIRALSLELPISTVQSVFRDCMEISDHLAAALVGCLMTDPSDVSTAFANGIWHRPLIKRDRTNSVLLVSGAIISGSPIRKIERWLIASGKADSLSRGARGLAYEADIRSRLAKKLAANPLLTDTACSPRAIKRGKDGEEIDIVIRLGRTIIVGEIKCLIIPSESLERYNHIGKIEAAADQAIRKSQWLQKNASALEASIGKLPCAIEDLRFVPLVILNNGIGIGLDIDGCIVTDAGFLQLFFGSGSYTSSAVFDFDGRQIEQSQTLYDSQSAAERDLIDVFSSPPGLAKFIPAVRWRWDDFPILDGKMKVSATELDETALQTPNVSAAVKHLMVLQKPNRSPQTPV